MRKWVKILIPSLLLAGGVILFAIRWQAWFGMPAEPEWTGDTVSYTFPSLSLDGRAGEGLTILVLGDIHSSLTQADYDTLAARVPQADAVAQVGDWMERGQDYYYQQLVHEWTNSQLNGLPVIATPGNHEYSKTLPKRVLPVWSKAFSHPHNGPVEVPGESYYLDFPQLRFIVIDTNPLDRLVYLTRTLTWLRALQKEAGNRFVVVMMHHPVLSVGKGRWNTLIYGAFRHALGQADLVIAGHDHSYMRRTPFVVLNTAGKGKTQHFHYTPEVSDTVPVYGVLTVNGSERSNSESGLTSNSPKDGLRFAVHRLSDGAQIDSLYVNHD